MEEKRTAFFRQGKEERMLAGEQGERAEKLLLALRYSEYCENMEKIPTFCAVVWKKCYPPLRFGSPLYSYTIERVAPCPSVLKLPNEKDGRLVTEIRSGALKECSEVKELVLPRGIVTLKRGVLEGCSKLKRLFLYRSFQGFAPNALRDCPLLQEVYFEGTRSAWENILSSLQRERKKLVTKDHGASFRQILLERYEEYEILSRCRVYFGTQEEE